MREYSQRFIKEMAKDRETSIQKIGVVISGLRRQTTMSGRDVYKHEDIDELFKSLRNETKRVVDQELTGITIKHFRKEEHGFKK